MLLVRLTFKKQTQYLEDLPVGSLHLESKHGDLLESLQNTDAWVPLQGF